MPPRSRAHADDVMRTTGINELAQRSQCNSATDVSVRFSSIARLTAILTLGLAAAIQPAGAVTATVDAERDGDAIDVRAVAMLHADAATAWRVLTDYNGYTAFIPDLRRSRVVARDGATVTVEQSGDAAIWLFKVPLEITFVIKEIPPDKLQSRAVAGSLRALTSSYTLTPTASGIRLEYTGRIAPGFEIFGQVEQKVVRRNVARQFQALADEIERQAGAAHARSSASVN
jgi:ribosome-associated toxin RatA of RatAB toxin-antitoxin module